MGLSPRQSCISSIIAENRMGVMKMCRMSNMEECREMTMGWILDNNNNQRMAVKMEDGWREIMVWIESCLDIDIISFSVDLSAWRICSKRRHQRCLASEGGKGFLYRKI